MKVEEFTGIVDLRRLMQDTVGSNIRKKSEKMNIGNRVNLV